MKQAKGGGGGRAGGLSFYFPSDFPLFRIFLPQPNSSVEGFLFADARGTWILIQVWILLVSRRQVWAGGAEAPPPPLFQPGMCLSADIET